MKRFLVLSLLVLASILSHAQSKYASVDKIALAIPERQTNNTDNIAAYINANFTTETDKVRAAFWWIVNNVSYDIANMYALNFYEKKEDRIKKVLATREGVCAHYADLFQDICTKAGLKAYLVEGYTKQNDFSDHVPHAWNAVSIDGTLYLFDPTWAAGYNLDGKFVRRINEAYFMVTPSKIIASHMPFDYMWQFLNYPYTYGEFHDGKPKPGVTKDFFAFADTLAAYEKLGPIEKNEAAARRIEANGRMTSMIYERLRYLKTEIENHRQNEKINIYNAATASYNKAVHLFNDYTKYYNKQFTPAKKDAEIKEMIDAVDRNLADARKKLASIIEAPEHIATAITDLQSTMGDFTARVNEQKEWVTKYLSKSKLTRKTMFYKYSVMGVPVN